MLKHPRTFLEGLGKVRGFIRELRDTEYDIAIDFQGLLKSGIVIGLARAARKIGFDRTRELSYLFLNEKLPPYDKDKHALERYLDIARHLGAKNPSPACTLPIERELAVVEERLGKIVRSSGSGVRSESKRRGDGETRGQGDEGRAGAGDALPRICVINPIARWKTKLWPERNFAELADRLIAERKAVVIFSGGPEDRAALDRIRGMMKQQAENWAGSTTLKELAALASLSNLFITTDTGPMHLAAAAGAKVLALFGPTAPWRTGPYGPGHIVVRKGLDCSPCFQRSCTDNVRCMKEITVDEVMTQVPF
jgi:3-deoxy-D-manno-octulosonic-acid transferase/heptosyltransferase-1